AAHDLVHFEPERRELSFVAHQHAHALAAPEQLPCKRLTDESGCTGHENFRAQVTVSPSSRTGPGRTSASVADIQFSGQHGMRLASMRVEEPMVRTACSVRMTSARR